ncbi:MAG TPA: HEAT repeat domain-containing protein, partial [Ktedonobacteraceae bacterium]
ELIHNMHDKAWEVRYATVEVLGNLGEKIPLKTLLAILDDKDDLIRRAAVEALGKRGKDVPRDVFLEALDDDDSGVRSAAIEALGEQTPVEKLIDEVFAPPVESFLNLEYARHAAEAVLAKRGEQEALKEIIAAGVADSPELREYVRAMVASYQETPQEELLAVLPGNHPETRKQAANILSWKNPALLEQIVASQETRQAVMRAIAVRMVGKLGEPTLVRVALQGLHDEDAKVRLAALLALRDLGEQVPAEAGAAAVDLLADEDWCIRTAALQVLFSLSEQIPVTFFLLGSLLILAAGEKYPPARDAAGQCIEKLGGHIPQELIDELLHDEEPEIRALTLQYLWPYIPMRQIQEALSDDDDDVRDAAVEAESRRKAQQVKAQTRYQQRIPISIRIEHMSEAQLVKKFCGGDVLRQVVTWREVTLGDLNNWKPRLWHGSGLGRGPLVVVDKDKITDPFTQAQYDLENDVRDQLMHLLKTHAPVDKLLEALDDEKPDVRLVALRAL